MLPNSRSGGGGVATSGDSCFQSSASTATVTATATEQRWLKEKLALSFAQLLRLRSGSDFFETPLKKVVLALRLAHIHLQTRLALVFTVSFGTNAIVSVTV